MRLPEKTVAMKRALATDGRRREVFGFLDAISLAFKTGYLVGDQTEDLIRNAKITPEELAEYRKARHAL